MRAVFTLALAGIGADGHAHRVRDSKTAAPRSNGALRFESVHAGDTHDGGHRAECDSAFLGFAEVHESIGLTRARAAAARAEAASCAAARARGAGTVSSSPCDIFDDGKNDQGGDILKAVGGTTVRKTYEATETALCMAVVDRLIPALLEADDVTQSQGYPVGTWTRDPASAAAAKNQGKQQMPTADADLNLGSCTKLKQARNELDLMWRSVVMGSRYVSESLMQNDDAGQPASDMASSTVSSGSAQDAAEGITQDAAPNEPVARLPPDIAPANTDKDGTSSGSSIETNTDTIPTNMVADGSSPTEDVQLSPTSQSGSSPDQTSNAKFRAVHRDETTAESLEKQIAATEARLEAYDANDAARRETLAAAQEVAYAKRLTEVRKQAEQRVTAKASLLELYSSRVRRLHEDPKEKERVRSLAAGLGCTEVGRIKSWFTKCGSKKRVEFRGVYYCCPTDVPDSSTWDEPECPPGTEPKAAKVLGCQLADEAYRGNLDSSGSISSVAPSVDCAESMRKLAGVDYNALRNDYDRFKHACDDIQGSLKKYVREELAKPRDQIQPVELQRFLTRYSLPPNIHEGICHLPGKAQGTLAAKTI